MITKQGSLHRLIVFIFLSIFLVFNTAPSPSQVYAQMAENAGASASMPPPPGWYAFANKGLDDGVFALEISGDDLYVGGSFDTSGDGTLTGMGGIARFNIPSNTWHTLPNNGLDDGVGAMALYRDNLYIGGHFLASGDGARNLANIARYDASANTWNALPNKGLNNPVTSFAVSGKYIYVGGWFEGTVDTTIKDLGHIVRYDTANKSWEALANQGLDKAVFALAAKAVDLYAAGRFRNSGDLTVKDMINIARYDTRTGKWHQLPEKGLNGDTQALAISGDDLYIGGEFSRTVEGSVTDLGNIVRFDTSTYSWHALPNQGLNGAVRSLAVSGDDLYLGGNFTETGDGSLVDLGGIARYDKNTNTWHPLPNQGFKGNLNALLVSGDGLFVGGNFTQTGDGWWKELGHVARSALDVEFLPLAFK